MTRSAWLLMVWIGLAAASTLSAQGLRNERILVEKNLPEVTAIAFSPDSKTLAAGMSDRTITLWDVMSEKAIANLEGQKGLPSSLVFSPDGKMLASGSADSGIRLWDVQTSKLTATLKEHKNVVHSVAFSPDGEILASGANWDTHPRLWNVKNGKCIATLEGCNDAVQAVAFSPGGKLLATGMLNAGLDLWDVTTGKRIARARGGDSVAFSPDGKTLAAGYGDSENGGRVHLWDVKLEEKAAK